MDLFKILVNLTASLAAVKRFYIFFIILWSGTCANAQNFASRDYYLIDSLILDDLTNEDREIVEKSMKAYHTATNDVDRINAVNQIVELSWDDALWSRYNQWLFDFTRDRLKAWPPPPRDTVNLFLYYLSNSISNEGMYEDLQGNIERAIDCYNQSLELCLKLESWDCAATNYSNIGVLYNDRGDYDEAIKCYTKAAEICESTHDTSSWAGAINNLGSVYRDLADFDRALDYFEQAVALFEKIDNQVAIAIVYNNISKVYLAQGQSDEALNCQLKSIELFEDGSDAFGMANSLTNLAWIYFNRNELDISEECAKRALSIAESSGHTQNIADAENMLYMVYKKKGNAADALAMYEHSAELKNLIEGDQVQKAIADQQAKFEYERKKAMDDAETEKILALSREEKKRQEVVTMAVTGGLGLLAVFFFFVINRLRITRRQKSLIASQHEKLEETHKEITDSIAYAQRIQSAILPPDKLIKDLLPQSFVLYKPKDVVAGDFYWLEAVDSPSHSDDGKRAQALDTIVLFAAADCTGHGVPGAMVSVVCNNALNRAVREYGLTEPGKILDKVREIVITEFEKSEEEVKDGMDIAVVSLTIAKSEVDVPLRTHSAMYAGAHNPLWIIRRDSSEIEEYKANKEPIGKYDFPKPFTTHQIELNSGDVLYIFSDGYVDQFGGDKGKKFKAKSLKDLLLSIHTEPMEQQKRLLDKAFEEWRGGLEQIDDVCVIGVRI